MLKQPTGQGKCLFPFGNRHFLRAGLVICLLSRERGYFAKEDEAFVYDSFDKIAYRPQSALPAPLLLSSKIRVDHDFNAGILLCPCGLHRFLNIRQSVPVRYD